MAEGFGDAGGEVENWILNLDFGELMWVTEMEIDLDFAKSKKSVKAAWRASEG